jgi:hypothetical protein
LKEQFLLNTVGTEAILMRIPLVFPQQISRAIVFSQISSVGIFFAAIRANPLWSYSSPLFLAAKLVPQPLETAFVNHFVEFFPIRVEFEASFPHFALIDLDVDGGQIAVEDQNADVIRHALHFP